ncbi:MAG: DUF2079 domain-containing protein [Ruminococcus sp.]|nr:DUF2079 domain-containing protein [Ruminococcus sp.]
MKSTIARLRADGILAARPLLCRLFGLYLLCAAVSVPLPLIGVVLPVGTAALTAIRKTTARPLSDALVLLSGLFLFCADALWRSGNAAQFVGISLFFVLTTLLLLRAEDFKTLRPLSPRQITYLLIGIPSALCVLISILCICRYLSYQASCFDLGIFAQMFHSMKTDLSQITTCERNEPLSHFSVHISPIYYLLLPLYLLIPATETLLIAQAVIALSGVIPLLLLCRHLNFGLHSRLMISLLYCASAAILTPCFYDFHENVFLPPLLLWFVYAAERGKYPLCAVSGILILLVKEDAPIYLLCIGLYYLCTSERRKLGAILISVSVAYFLVALHLLDQYGEGAMVHRTYGDLMSDPSGGIGTVICSVLRNPARFLSLCFSAEKLPFLLAMLLPLAFLPLITKRPARLFFCLPFAVMNLAPSYPYAADIRFQYVFGTFTCLLCAALLNLSDLSQQHRRTLLPMMTAVTCLGCICFNSGNLSYLPQYLTNRSSYAQTADALDSIPPDASVCADSWYLPHLAQRRTLYLLQGAQPALYHCDYAVVNASDEHADVQIAHLTAEGYQRISAPDDRCILFQKPDYIAQNQLASDDFSTLGHKE